MSAVGGVRGSARVVALGGLAGITGAGWIYVATGAGVGPVMHGMCTTGSGMMQMASMASVWTPGYAALMLTMWDHHDDRDDAAERRARRREGGQLSG